MRVVILSDIHGNLVALNAVLSDTRRRRVDEILCLGDVAATGPQPCEVIERLQRLRWPCVMGNSDEALARNVPDIPARKKWEQLPEEEKRRLRELDEWTRRRLSKSDRSYLSTFKPTVMFEPKNGPKFLCYHGSPKSNSERIEAATTDQELELYLDGHEADIFAGGHTHTQMFRRFGPSIIVNPGSVGLPFERGPSGRVRNPTRAEYALASFGRRSLSLEFLRAAYSKADLEAAVRDSGLPNPEWWLSDWY